MPSQVSTQTQYKHATGKTKQLTVSDSAHADNSGCLTATNLEVHIEDHHPLDYCTFGLQAANNAQTVRLDTAYGKRSQHNLLKINVVL